MNKDWYVYIISNKKRGVLYIGVTSNLAQRIYQHKHHLFKNSFSDKYKLNKLVYYEIFYNHDHAFTREKILKKWKREWKISLIENNNSTWQDLYYSLF